MPRHRKRAKLPMTSPWLEHWSKCQTEINIPDGYDTHTPPRSGCSRNTRDVGTQTPPSLLYMAVAEESSRDMESVALRSVQMRSRRNSASDWTQMGMELRQIADDLKQSSESLERSYSGSPTSRLSSLNYVACTIGSSPLCPQYFRRRSLPEGTLLFRRPQP